MEAKALHLQHCAWPIAARSRTSKIGSTNTCRRVARPNLHPEQPPPGAPCAGSRRRSWLGRKDRLIDDRRRNHRARISENIPTCRITSRWASSPIRAVCIGCKACEVACKEWNQVPDDGFTWTGNSYDNTGHLGASTWRHVMFLEQDRAKGDQIAGPMSLATIRIRFAGYFCPMFANIAKKPAVSKRVRPAQLCALKSARSLCKTMFATAVAIASSRVHSV